MFLEARCNATAVFDPVEEAFDAITLPVERLGEAMSLGSVGLVGNVGGRALGLDMVPYPIGIIGFVGQQDIAVSKAIEKRGGAEYVMGLARCERHPDGQAPGVRQHMDFGGQSSSRAAHTMNCVAFFTLAAC